MKKESKGEPTASPQAPTQVSYSTYLKVPELLALQEPLSKPPAHDELLFIVIHQTYELWFKQVLYELEALIGTLLKNELVPAQRLLNRVTEIFKVLVHQVDILETMTPVEFNRFRSNLNPASGFQSAQFRELEILGGLDVQNYMKFATPSPEWEGKLQRRMKSVNLRTALLQLIALHGLNPSRESEKLKDAILTIYQDPKHQSLYALCEQLITVDELILLWRFRHVQMVERMIGLKKGTGGSGGVPYLQQTLNRRFFPELWESRTEMTGAY